MATFLTYLGYSVLWSFCFALREAVEEEVLPFPFGSVPLWHILPGVGGRALSIWRYKDKNQVTM